MTAIRVLIVDDQELLRRGLRMILETDSGLQVVGEADNGMHALALIPQLAPDVVLADARLPVLALTTFDDARLVRELLDAGAAGFLLKDISTDALTDAIRQVLAGGLVLDPRVARAALSTARPADRHPALTDTEQAVADLIARGLPNAEIAARLHLAHGTVKNTVSALLRKLDEPDRTALALRLARGLDA
jgi:DNA-binding NarL/FixJ family response regulator